jgi:hypothetical protein
MHVSVGQQESLSEKGVGSQTAQTTSATPALVKHTQRPLPSFTFFYIKIQWFKYH